MNQTSDLAAQLVANPPAELQELLNDPRTTDSAREAVSDLVQPPPAADKVNGHGSGFAPAAGGSTNGRLQIVDEKQNFTQVEPLSPSPDERQAGSELTI